MDGISRQQQDLTCPRCGAIFAYPEDFEQHMSSHMTGSPTAPHICTACGASFDTREALDEHGRVHMDEELAA